MRNFKLQRLTLILWFLNYTVISMVSYIFGNGRPFIMVFILYSAVMTAVELSCLGWIEDTM